MSFDECFFYHVMDLPDLGTTIAQPGSWDLRGRFADYTGHVDMRGRSVLDVGTASGFLTFEAEHCGASAVTSFDADSYERMQYLPLSSIPDGRARFAAIRKSYHFAHTAFKSKARLVCGDLYRMSELVPPADIVLVGQILVHLRDPLGALREAALTAKDYLIVTEGALDDERPIAQFLGGGPDNFYAWWHLSTGLYRAYLGMLGFGTVSVVSNTYKHHAPGTQQMLYTIVARRGASP